jgi:hypothetical protein
MFELFTAGLFPLIWNNMLGIGFIGAAVAFAVFSPVFKKTAIAVAVAGFCWMFAYNLGVKNEYARMEAQRIIRERQFGEQLDEARAAAQKTIDRAPDSGGVGGVRGKGDKYDRAE